MKIKIKKRNDLFPILLKVFTSDKVIQNKSAKIRAATRLKTTTDVMIVILMIILDS
jgi:hypothetical protein